MLAPALASVAVPAGAAEVPATPLVGQGPLLQTLLGLAAVVMLILGLAWLLRQVFRLQPTLNGQMRVLGGLSLGPRERVVLIKVGEAQLVVGTTPGRIQTLHVLDKPLAEDAEADLGQGGRFARQLSQALGRRKLSEADHG